MNSRKNAVAGYNQQLGQKRNACCAGRKPCRETNRLRYVMLAAFLPLLVSLYCFVMPGPVQAAQVVETVVYNNWNTWGVAEPPSITTDFVISEPYAITYIDTCHNNNGAGATPGTISFKHSDGTVYGPFQSIGITGNTAWVVNFNDASNPAAVNQNQTTLDTDIKYPILKAGSYRVIDSSNSTWSYNSTSLGAGFTCIKGYPASQSPVPTALAAAGLTPAGFTARWSAMTGAAGYQLDVATDAAFTSYVTGFQNLDVGNVTLKAVTGLVPNTTYYYRVRAYMTNNGNNYAGNDSSTITAQTSIQRYIRTVAGIPGQRASDTVEGKPATSTSLYAANGVVLDTQGNIYVSDLYTVRRVDASGGKTITIAGQPGQTGSTGDNGPAIGALLNGVNGLSFDAAGNLYISDHSNHAIRKVDMSTGIITTAAGNYVANYTSDNSPAAGNPVYYPSAPAFDSSGTVYFAEMGNNVVRKIVSGNLVTVAGVPQTGQYSGDGGLATSAGLNKPYGLAFDSAGNLYIADRGNHVVRKVEKTTGNISTFAGTGVFGYSGDGGLATQAQLACPHYLAFDQAGNLYISENDSSIIRKVDTAGIITTYAGNTTTSFTSGAEATATGLSFPTQIACDAAGNLYIADFNHDSVSVVSPYPLDAPRAGAATAVAGNEFTANWSAVSGATGYKLDVATDPTFTSLTVNDVNVSNVTSYVVNGLTANTVYYYRVRAYNANGISMNSNMILARPMNQYTVATVAGMGPTAGGYSGNGGQAAAAQLTSPDGVAFDAAGNLYIADENHVIRKIDGAGVITTVAGTGTAGYAGDNGLAAYAQINENGVSFDNAGNMYISDHFNHRIRKVTSGGVITTVAGNGTQGYDAADDGGQATSAMLSHPSAPAFDSSGNMYFAEASSYVIRKVTPAGIISTFAGIGGDGGSSGDGGLATAAKLNWPYSIVFDAADNLYFADRSNHSVRKIDTNGVITRVAGNGGSGYTGDGGPATSASLLYPFGLARDSAGNLYISENHNCVIRRVDAGGNISTVVGAGIGGYTGDGGLGADARLNFPNGMAFDTAGSLYVADRTNHAVRKITFKVPAASTASAGTSSTAHSLTACWGSVSGATGYSLDVATDSDFTAYVTGYRDFSTGNVTSCNVTGLTPGTTYYYRVRTLNLGGESANSNTQSVTTLSAANSDATLASLEISQGTLSPGFNAGTTSYDAGTVVNSVTSVTVKPTISQTGAAVQVKINSGTFAAVTSGCDSQALSLNLGSNTITIQVTAPDAITTADYTITITRALSCDATLSSLEISQGTLSPGFDAGTTSYDAGTVANSVTSMTVKPTVNQSGATVQVKINSGTFAGVTSGTDSQALSLNPGPNTITIQVTAPDTTTTSNYIITMTRAFSSDATLASLEISQGTLSPNFDAGTTSYDAGTVANSVASMTVKPTVSESGAAVQVKINSGTFAAVTSGTDSQGLGLNPGSNTITVRVTAPDSTTGDYTITIARALSSVATLSDLTLSIGQLSPGFDGSVKTYSTELIGHINTIAVTPTAASSSATVTVNGTSVTSGAGCPVSLNEGVNTITVALTAQDFTTDTYTLTVVRKGVKAVIACGTNHSLVVNNGAVTAFGDNSAGQCDVPDNCSTGVVTVAAGGSQSMAVLSDGSMFKWGQTSSE